jgi:hypothetical protein
MVGKMKITPNWEIKTDTLNFILCHKVKTKFGNENWKEEAYFRSPANALDYLVLAEVRGSGMKDLESVVAKINSIHKVIAALPGWQVTIEPTETTKEEKPDVRTRTPRTRRRRTGK